LSDECPSSKGGGADYLVERSDLARTCKARQLLDLVLLDDYMGPVDRATDAMPLIRRAGYVGPVVVISGGLTRARHNELMQIGVAAAPNKDDLDSGSIAGSCRGSPRRSSARDITSPLRN
jgi:hypothetical protein